MLELVSDLCDVLIVTSLICVITFCDTALYLASLWRDMTNDQITQRLIS